MVKIKSADTLSLDKSRQRKVSKETKSLKKKIKEGKISIKEHISSLNIKNKRKKIKEDKTQIKSPKKQKKEGKVSIKKFKKPKRFINSSSKRGLIYLGHIPHGFYENEMKKYFKQFGAVTNVKVCRSRRTGNSKGYGYVEFAHPDVAKIAAETMNNYLMFKKKIISQYVPYEKRPKGLFTAKSSTPTNCLTKIRRENQIAENGDLDSETHLKRSKSRLKKLNKKMEKLKKMGFDCDIKPVDVPDILNVRSSEFNESNSSDSQSRGYIYEANQCSSETEIIPLRKSKKSYKSLGSLNSKVSPKSNNVEKSPLEKILHAKSLNSINTSISPNISGKSKSSLDSLKKLSKATSTDIKIKKERRVAKSKGISKKKNKKELPLNSETVKKIARELIRKRGDSLLNIVTTPKKRKISKKK